MRRGSPVNTARRRGGDEGATSLAAPDESGEQGFVHEETLDHALNGGRKVLWRRERLLWYNWG